MKVKQIIIGLLIAVAVVFIGLAGHAQADSRPMDIIVNNSTNYVWNSNCVAQIGHNTACPGPVSANSIVTFSFDAPTMSVQGDSGDVILTTQGPKGMVTITISFKHPYSSSATTLNATIAQDGSKFGTTLDRSQLQHHHAVGTVTINAN